MAGIATAARCRGEADEVVILQRCGTLLEDGTRCEAKLKLRDKEQQWVKCPNCGSWFSVEAVRREQALKARGEPMTPKDCRAYLAKQAGAKVKPQDMKNWAYLGHLNYVLERVNTTGRDVRMYFPGDVLRTSRRMNERRTA